MSNLATLKPFKKGFDPRRNSTGKNKYSISITKMLKKKLSECPPGTDKRTYAQMLVDNIVHKSATKKNRKMMEKVWAYIDGLPKATQDINIKTPVPLFDNTTVGTKLKDNELLVNNETKEELFDTTK